MSVLDQDSFNRLAGLIIALDDSLPAKGGQGYIEAVDLLEKFKLNLICGPQIGSSAALQASLLTAVNTGKRCFLGGVQVILEQDEQLLVPWHSAQSLATTILELGGDLIKTVTPNCPKIFFGCEPDDYASFRVVCNGWQGGVLKKGSSINIESTSDKLVLGGIFAGALAVGLNFRKQSGLDPLACNQDSGLSLWRPDLDWTLPEAKGPVVSLLPDKLWLVGLGHLGQANVWTLGFLPYELKKPLVQLQDFDLVVKGNYEAGLLCDKNKTLGKSKVKVCGRWLEARGFDPRYIERKYDKSFSATTDDPPFLLSGFDSAEVRQLLNPEGLRCILDAGVGGGLDFDSITLINFPFYRHLPGEVWKNSSATIQNKNLHDLTSRELGCGFVKGISTAFVGAITSTLVFSELLRGLNDGRKYSIISCSVGKLKHRSVVSEGDYSSEFNTGTAIEVGQVQQ